MGTIRTAKTSDVAAFPAAAYVVDGSPAVAQCQEAQIDEAAGAIADGPVIITDVAAFAAIDLAGKKVTVTAPVGDAGTFSVISNTDDILTTDHAFGEISAVCAYTVHDDGQVYLTRNMASFRRYIEENAAAHATINGQLYSDIASPPLNGACSDTWSPG